MSTLENQQTVEKLWAAFDRFDFEAVGPLLHDNFVCEWPQSHERIRGRENFIAVNKHYPGQWRIVIQKILASGDDVVTKTELRYDNQIVRAISFFEFQGGKIIRLREHWPTDYAAPDWRARWVEHL